jgi:hypothetical protein
MSRPICQDLLRTQWIHPKTGTFVDDLFGWRRSVKRFERLERFERFERPELARRQRAGGVEFFEKLDGLLIARQLL